VSRPKPVGPTKVCDRELHTYDAQKKQCPECKNAARRAKYRADPERFLAEHAAWVAANPAVDQKRKRRWYDSNRTLTIARARQNVLARTQEIAEYQAAYSKAKPEKGRTARRKWKRKNPEAVLTHTHKRRARLADALGTHTAEEWEAVKAQFEYRCIDCGMREGERYGNGRPMKLTRGHAVPLCMKGCNCRHNLIPQCKRCNSIQGHHRVHVSASPCPQYVGNPMASEMTRESPQERVSAVRPT
jgi:hypothetical protein